MTGNLVETSTCEAVSINQVPPGSFSAYGAWYNIHQGGQQDSILKCKG